MYKLKLIVIQCFFLLLYACTDTEPEFRDIIDKRWCSVQSDSMCCESNVDCGKGCQRISYTCREKKCLDSESEIRFEWESSKNSDIIKAGCFKNDKSILVHNSSKWNSLFEKMSFTIISSPINNYYGRDLELNDIIRDNKGYPICREICSNQLTRHLCYGLYANNKKSFDNLYKFRDSIFSGDNELTQSEINNIWDMPVNFDRCDNSTIRVSSGLISRNSPTDCYIYSLLTDDSKNSVTELNLLTPSKLRGKIDPTVGSLTKNDKNALIKYNRATFEPGMSPHIIVRTPKKEQNGEKNKYKFLEGDKVSFEYYHTSISNYFLVNSNSTNEVFYFGPNITSVDDFEEHGCLYIIPPQSK